MFLTKSLVLGFSMLPLLSSVLPPLLPALSDLAGISHFATGQNAKAARLKPFQLKAVVSQSTVLHGLQSLFRRGLLLEGDEAETHGQNLFGSRIFLGRHTCREHLVVTCIFLYA